MSETHNCNKCWYSARHISLASLFFHHRFYDNVCWIRTVIERDIHVSINFNDAVDFKRMSGPSRMPVCLSCYDWTLTAPVLSQIFWIRVTFHLQWTALADKSPVRPFEYPVHFAIQAFSLHSFTTARTSLGHHVPTTDTLKYSTQSSHPLFHGPGYPTLHSDSLRAGLSGDRIPVRACFSPPIKKGPGAHPASCTMGTGSLSRR